MNIVIIEDEPLMAQALEKAILAVRPDFHIQQILGSIQASLDYLHQANMPDLFFSDIHLSDGLSFEIFKQLSSSSPIIFCTAFDEYALEAFRVNGIDYILKPFEVEDIKAAIDKYASLQKKTNLNKETLQEFIQSYTSHQTKPATTLLVYQGEKIIPIAPESITLFSLENNACYVYTNDGQRFVVKKTLDELSEKLGDSFFRINRQCMINRQAVRSVSPYFGRKLIIQPAVVYEGKMIVSKAKASQFLHWLEGA